MTVFLPLSAVTLSWYGPLGNPAGPGIVTTIAVLLQVTTVAAVVLVPAFRVTEPAPRVSPKP